MNKFLMLNIPEIQPKILPGEFIKLLLLYGINCHTCAHSVSCYSDETLMSPRTAIVGLSCVSCRNNKGLVNYIPLYKMIENEENDS